jgi:hypothetical protein
MAQARPALASTENGSKKMTLLRAAAIVSLVLAGTSASAQTVYKCQTKDGKMAFSDQPCDDGAKAAAPPPPKSAPPKREPTSMELATKAWKDLCDKGEKQACELVEKTKGTSSPVDAFKALARDRCAEGDLRHCEVAYCEDPSARLCLEKMGRASGARWYERLSLGKENDGRMNLSIACREAPVETRILCRFPKGNCQHDVFPPGGRPNPTVFNTLNAAANDACDVLLADYRRRNPGGAR